MLQNQSGQICFPLDCNPTFIPGWLTQQAGAGRGYGPGGGKPSAGEDSGPCLPCLVRVTPPPIQAPTPSFTWPNGLHGSAPVDEQCVLCVRPARSILVWSCPHLRAKAWWSYRTGSHLYVLALWLAAEIPIVMMSVHIEIGGLSGRSFLPSLLCKKDGGNSGSAWVCRACKYWLMPGWHSCHTQCRHSHASSVWLFSIITTELVAFPSSGVKLMK